MRRAEESWRPEEVAAERIAHYREQRGLSRPELAERLADYGLTFSNPSVSLGRIETGAARLRLDDVVTFAAALGVPLVALLVPVEPWATVKPGKEAEGVGIGRDHFRDFVCGLDPWDLMDEPTLRAAALEHVDGLVPSRTREDIRAAATALAQRRREELEAERRDDIETKVLDNRELQQWRVKSGNHQKKKG